MVRLGFFLTLMPRMREDLSRDSNPPRSVELHQTGTFEGRSTDWATAALKESLTWRKQRYFWKQKQKWNCFNKECFETEERVQMRFGAKFKIQVSQLELHPNNEGRRHTLKFSRKKNLVSRKKKFSRDFIFFRKVWFRLVKSVGHEQLLVVEGLFELEWPLVISNSLKALFNPSYGSEHVE